MHSLLLDISDATTSDVYGVMFIFIMAIVGMVTTAVYLVKFLRYLYERIRRK